MIAWTPSLSVGIEEIDAQHRELFRAADAFISSVESSTATRVAALLAYLRNYALTHFAEEEGWMREFSFPEFGAHKAQHERFLRDLEALATEHGRRDGPGLEPMRVATWLGRWLVDHVSASDTRLARYIVSRSA